MFDEKEGYSVNESIFSSDWCNTQLGIAFEKLGFHMFTVDRYLSELEDDGEQVIRLTLGKSDRPVEKSVKEAMVSAMDNTRDLLRVDSEGNMKLRSEIVKYYNSRFEKKIQPQNVIIGSQGTSSLFRDLFILLLQDGGEVLLPRPGYILYEASARLMQAICKHDIYIRYYDIDLVTNKLNLCSFTNNFDSEKNRIVVINSPSNPTGCIVSRQEFEVILSTVNSGNRCVLISDQVYSNVVFHGHEYSSILDKEVNEKIHIPYIVTDSFSKGFEMYTFRVGFAILPLELIKPVTIFQRNFSLTPSTLSQFGAIAAINQTERVEDLRRLYQKRSDYVCKKFYDVNGIDILEAKGGFYCILKCTVYMKKHGIINDVELALDIARKTYPHIGTVPCSDFGIADSIRISFSPQDFEKGIDELVEYFQR